MKDVKQLISEMTLEEKASLCSGQNFWRLKSNERLGIPSIFLTDGPHGLRKQLEREGTDISNLTQSVPATCFPTASALAATWNRDLIFLVGVALGEECRQEKVSVILGPGVNIKRSPLCGRNFEYFSEDPYLTGEMAKSYIRGVQSQGVGTSIKHYAVNNQEFHRMTIDTILDERTLREIYLTGFEIAVKQSQPWTVMCSYNRLNGADASENQPLLTKILKQEWGFEGAVISDWGAVHSTAAPINNGLDLEMPGPAKWFGILLEEAVQTWQVDEVKINQAAARILSILFRSGKMVSQRPILPATGDTPEHRALARQLAQESITLLKNEDHVLPLDLVKIKKLAVVGLNATMRITGGGSSHVKGHYWVTPLEGLRLQLGDQV